MASVRRLTAILAADVAGYSRLMGADEEGTHERLRAHLRELVNPKIAEHRGRLVKNTGDGLLAEFASVVDAVRCATEIQRGMVDGEPNVPQERRIRFRIGINLGDVIAEEHDIFGDGVNVAARLEALAQPGGILVSNTVYEHVRDRLPFAFEDLGEQQVKNIARPVRVYALRREAMAGPTTSSAPLSGPVSQIAGAPRLSIVVLPFTNLSDDREQQYFADGITEDLTTDLSRIADMLVISRNSAFTYKDRSVNAKQIGRELSVRYVLEGGLRRSGKQLRVTAQLIDAETDAHLWAERFDRDTGDLFAVQDEITSRIAVALNLELVGAEADRLTEHPDALDHILRGRAVMSKPPSRENYADAIGFFERALALDLHSVEAQSLLATVLASRVLDQMSDSAATDIARADRLTGQALTASPRNPLAHWAKGHVLRAQNRFEEAITEYETVIAFNRNRVGAYAHLGQCKFYQGSIEEYIPLVERAIRLSPRDAQVGVWFGRIGLVHLLHEPDSSF
jgi:TolB-like protein/class 3 adenylate cyclase